MAFAFYAEYIPWDMPIVLLCFIMLWLYSAFLVDSRDLFSHIFQGYFTDIGKTHMMTKVAMK